jgi:hypothetical protein
MKNLILSCLPLLMLTACSTDPVKDNTLKTALVGKWELEEKLQGTNPQTLNACEQQNSLEFTKDGLVTDQDYGDNGNGECGEVSTIGTYVVKDHSLKITIASIPFEETILELTANSLVLMDNEQYRSTYKRVK